MEKERITLIKGKQVLAEGKVWDLSSFSAIECPICDRLVPPVKLTKKFNVTYKCKNKEHGKFKFVIDENGDLKE